MIITVSGASGVGKDTITDYLFDILPRAEFLPSYTTRQLRVGDRGYIYVTDKEFLSLERRGSFAWSVGVFKNRYGTRIADISRAVLDQKNIWLSIIIPDRVELLRTWSEDLGSNKVLSLYLYCKDEQILRDRVTKRGDNDVEKRIEECRSWNTLASEHRFFKWIDNSGELESTKKEVDKIIRDSGFLDLDLEQLPI